MTQLALDLFVSGNVHPKRTPPPARPVASDPELWAAVFHPDGFDRLASLMDQRHGGDDAAKLADLRRFCPPDRYVVNERTGLGSNRWAGVIVVLTHQYGGGR